jgi:hypothetical protein
VNSKNKNVAKSDANASATGGTAVAEGGSSNVSVDVKVEKGAEGGGGISGNSFSFSGGGGGEVVVPVAPPVIIIEPVVTVPTPEIWVTFTMYDPVKKTLIDKKERVWVFVEANVTKTPTFVMGSPTRVNITLDEDTGAKFMDYKGWTWVCKPKNYKK